MNAGDCFSEAVAELHATEFLALERSHTTNRILDPAALKLLHAWSLTQGT